MSYSFGSCLSLYCPSQTWLHALVLSLSYSVFTLSWPLGNSQEVGSVTKLCPILPEPMDCSTSVFPVSHHLPEFAQVESPSNLGFAWFCLSCSLGWLLRTTFTIYYPIWTFLSKIGMPHLKFKIFVCVCAQLCPTLKTVASQFTLFVSFLIAP